MENQLISRRAFLSLAGLAGAGVGLAACAQKLKVNSPNPDQQLAPVEREPWETPEVLSMGAVLGEASPELAQTLVQGFTMKKSVPMWVGDAAIADGSGTSQTVWRMIKNPSGGIRSAVYYNTSTGSWLKVLQPESYPPTPQLVAHFEDGVKAFRESMCICLGDKVPQFQRLIPIQTNVKIGEQVFSAFEMGNIGPTLNVLVETGKIKVATAEGKLLAEQILQQSYVNAIRLARQGYWFTDTNLKNILVYMDDSGNLVPEIVVNIDFTNRELRVAGSWVDFRSGMIGKFKTEAQELGVVFDVKAAEQVFDAEFITLMKSQTPISAISTGGEVTTIVRKVPKILVSDTGDVTPIVEEASEMVEEIGKIVPDGKAIPIGADVISVDVGAQATAVEVKELGITGRVMNILRSQELKRALKFGGAVLKVVGDMGILLWLADLITEPSNPGKWGEVKVPLYDRESTKAMLPKEEFDNGMAYKNDMRLREIYPEYEALASQRWGLYKVELAAWMPEGTPQKILDNKAFDMLESFTKEIKDPHMMPRKLTIAGPGAIDQPRQTNINFSSVKQPDGNSMFIVWRDIPENITPEQFNFEDYILYAIKIGKEDKDSELVFQGSADVTVEVPGTNETVGNLYGAIIYDEASKQIRLLFDPNDISKYPSAFKILKYKQTDDDRMGSRPKGNSISRRGFINPNNWPKIIHKILFKYNG